VAELGVAEVRAPEHLEDRGADSLQPVAREQQRQLREEEAEDNVEELRIAPPGMPNP